MDQLFNNLSYLIGSEVEILGWDPDRQYPDRIRVIMVVDTGAGGYGWLDIAVTW